MVISYCTGIYRFYRNGFRTMTLGKTLWKIILIKLIVMFAILKLFFFPDFLKSNFSTDQQRANHVFEQITGPARNPPWADTDRNSQMPDRHGEP